MSIPSDAESDITLVEEVVVRPRTGTGRHARRRQQARSTEQALAQALADHVNLEAHLTSMQQQLDEVRQAQDELRRTCADLEGEVQRLRQQADRKVTWAPSWNRPQDEDKQTGAVAPTRVEPSTRDTEMITVEVVNIRNEVDLGAHARMSPIDWESVRRSVARSDNPGPPPALTRSQRALLRFEEAMNSGDYEPEQWD